MNAFVLNLSDGTLCFVGLVMILVAQGGLLKVSRALYKSVLTIVVLVGAVLVLLSATPLALWVYIVWGVLVLGGLVVLSNKTSSRHYKLSTYCILLAVSLAILIFELPYHFFPKMHIESDVTIYVIGDSISAGIGTDHQCWPEVLGRVSNHKVVNLAKAGAKISTANVQAKAIAQGKSLVIIEMGGNDLLGGTTAKAFYESLDRVIASLSNAGHHILMIELPLIPFKNAYGKAQRSIAGKYNITMLPKRYFTKVFATQEGTLDGLHLSQSGHNLMAQIIHKVIR